MLIEFRVSNHRSISSEQVLTMEVGRTTAPDAAHARAVDGADQRLLTVAAIYGANASGKSNVISALDFFVHAVTWSHRAWAPEGGVPRDPFAWGADRDAPSVFEGIFVVDGVRYEYGFSANDDVFLEEWLYAWPHGRKQCWFEREGQEFKFGEHLHGENRLSEQSTRPNSLFLSAAVQNRHEQLSKVHAWFRLVRIAGAPERRPNDASLTHFLRFERDDRQLSLFSGDSDPRDERFKSVIELLQAADIGIVDMKLERAPSRPSVGQLRRERYLDDIVVRHRSKTGEAWLPLREESSGTKMLFHLAYSFLSTLRVGGLLVVDELEASLHPLLGLHLVRQFNDPVKNQRNAQLIFTTHDTNLLGTSLGAPALQRDQVWLTEKDEDGATHLYPLTDYKPRKAENIETGYLQGRYGAIPFLGELAADGE
jgi:predicted ATPase